MLCIAICVSLFSASLARLTSLIGPMVSLFSKAAGPRVGHLCDALLAQHDDLQIFMPRPEATEEIN